jgi:hypothetical protein
MKTTNWANETFGLHGWTPATAQDFIDHCDGCGFGVPHDDVVMRHGSIWVRCSGSVVTGSVPEIIDGFARVTF